MILINLYNFLLQIFFVLHKKNEHISILHVIHHGCMPMSVWFGVKFTAGTVYQFTTTTYTSI